MIRLARRDDLEAVRALAQESILHSIPPGRDVTREEAQLAMLRSLETLEEDLARDRNLVLLVDVHDRSRELRGYVLLEFDHLEPATGEKQCFIVDLAVAPTFRGGLTVKRLVDKASQLVRARGLKYLVGTVSANNTAALRIQSALGFEIERHQIMRRCDLG